MEAHMTNQLQTLRNNLGKLSERNQSFAKDLLAQHDRGRTLSPKQAEWVGKLAEMATAEPKEMAKVEVKGIIDLFDKAIAAGKKKIAIRLDGGDAGEIRLSLAGPNSAIPGAINVCDTGSFEDRKYYGRIDREGNFHASMKNTAPANLIESLQHMAKDPTGYARVFGQKTGSCCFCTKELTTTESMTRGYGPECAKKFGLPWG
jgi:hypothetical protein